MNYRSKPSKLILPNQDGLSRRRFLSQTAAVGALASSGLLLNPGKALANTPKKGGVLRMGLVGGATTDTLDPLQYLGTVHASQVFNCIFDKLTNVAPGGKIVPMLAESWDTNDDASVWKFALRKGVTFHDGSAFTAKDVAYSMKRAAGEDNTRPGAKAAAQAVTNIIVENDHSIVFELNGPRFDFDTEVSEQGLYMIKEGATDFANPIGTGPYSLVSFEPGVRAKVKKYAGFWSEDEGHFDEVELINMADAASRSNAVRNGDVDVIDRPDVATASRLRAVPGIEFAVATGGQHYTTPMRVNGSPLDNNDVRMAIKFGVKRQEFVDKVLGGFGAPGNDTPINSSYAYFNDSLEQRVYDPDKAMHHWKKSGLDASSGLTLTSSDGAFSGAVSGAQLIQASMASAGIDIKVKTVPGDGYWSDVWRVVPWCFCYWNGAATIGNQLSYYTSDNAYNDTAFQSETFDKLVADAAVQKDQALRAELYGEAQKILHEEGGTVTLAFASFVQAGSSKLGHGEVGALAPADDHALARRWWWAES
ncbi:ABC transporter substrate-binding protein [Leisingera sp. S232]|uniref:ABC transporter substrate-binding protein n=1 Tax=Leisingera sp. S232 TaxID=3415132 RepID=UPI003C7E9643